MYTVQPSVFEAVADHARAFQAEVEQLAACFALKVEGGFPVLELQVHPQLRAQLEYTLWGEKGVVAIRGNLQSETKDAVPREPFRVTMKVSFSHDPAQDMEAKKQRVEEISFGDAEVFWSIPPAGHIGHVEMTASFFYHPGSGQLTEYARRVLGILTDNVLAA